MIQRPLYDALKAHYPDRFHVSAAQIYTQIGHPELCEGSCYWDAVEVWFWPLK